MTGRPAFDSRRWTKLLGRAPLSAGAMGGAAAT